MSTPKCITIKTWDKQDYKKFVEYLISIQDIKYKEFHSSLVLNSKYEMIGIRVPIMRDIAKKISRSYIEEFLEYAENKYYEEKYFKEAIKMALNKAEFISRVGLVII